MSGGKGRTDYAVHIAVEETAVNDVLIDTTTKTRKLEIESHDEVYYPVVSILRPRIMNNSVTNELTKIEPESVESEPVKSKVEMLVNTMEEKEKPTRRSGSLKRWRARFGTILVAAIAVCAVVLVGLRLAGFRTFTVMSGSMEPEYPVGAMIYVRPVDYRSLNVGDVISYVANDEKTVVTHRIAEIEIDKNDANVWRFKTKGDGNAVADSKLVHYKNVLGTPVIVLPYIGYFAHNIQQPPGVYIALVVGTLLLAWTFLPGTLEERRKTARKSVA